MAGTEGTSPLPRDAQVVESVLRSSGVENFDAEVVPQLLEFTQRYIADVLEESVSYMEHRTAGAAAASAAGVEGGAPQTKKQQQAALQREQQLTEGDIMLAVRSRNAFGYAQMPPREVREGTHTPPPPSQTLARLHTR